MEDKEFYTIDEVIEIAHLFGNIKYHQGELESKNNPLGHGNPKNCLESIKQYENKVPEKIKNEFFKWLNVKRVESMCESMVEEGR